MSHAPMVSQRPRPPPRTRPRTCSLMFGLNATIVACPLGARSSVAEQSAHNRSVVGSIPAGPTHLWLNPSGTRTFPSIERVSERRFPTHFTYLHSRFWPISYPILWHQRMNETVLTGTMEVVEHHLGSAMVGSVTLVGNSG